MSIVGSEQWMYSSGAEFYDFPLEQSLRFNDNDSAYLSKTPSSAGNRKTWTWSGWVKRGNLGSFQNFFIAGTSGSSYTTLFFDSSDKLSFQQLDSSTQTTRGTSLAVFRDVSAWYNIVFAYDSTQATNSNGLKLYVNGVQQTLSFAAYQQNSNAYINSTSSHGLGGLASVTSNYFDGYIAEVNFIDGQALGASSFGETKSGIWIPKDTSGLTYGTNGFRLNFADTVQANGFNTVTYTGTGSTQAINGVGFSSSPDLVWIKDRTTGSSHRLHDSVRGAGIKLSSDSTGAEVDESSSFTSFNADGFSIAGSAGAYNTSGRNYVAWAWDAGTGSAGSNTDGSITSTVKANTDYGFSIVSYTGTGSAATVGHGLTTAPDMIIAKRRNTTGSWGVYHSGMTSATYQMWLNLTNGETSRPAQWNSTAPTSSVFSIGTDTDVNASGSDYIAYCFHSVSGYSSISSYTGDGTTDGSKTITTGFKPAFVMMKNASTGSTSWLMFDNTRDTKPTIELELNANYSQQEYDNNRDVTFTDTGFTVAGNNNINGSGDTYIFMAFKDTRDAAFWRDVSGQGNDWQHNNLTFSDVVPDGTNNFATFNEIGKAYSDITMAEGNLKATYTNGSGWSLSPATMSMSSGKWYWESTVSQVGGYGEAFGMLDAGDSPINAGRNYNGYRALGYGWAGHDNAIRHNNVSLYSPGTYSANDIICAAYDADTRELWLRVNNGSWIGGGDPATGTSAILTLAEPQGGGYIPSMAGYNSTVGKFNFGQDSTFQGARAAGGNADENGYGDFQYAVPSGFLSLCSANLPSGAIDTLADETPEDYFNTALFSATSGVAGSVTGYGFAPDWIWTKARNTGQSHQLFDNVRGDGVRLITNSTGAEADLGASYLSLEADGFDYGTGTFTSNTYVGWGWKAGGTGVSNTDGSITSTVSVGATSQQNWFSIVSYVGNGTAGATVGHGLNTQPSMIIAKNRDNGTKPWTIYHEGVHPTDPADYRLQFDTSGITNDNTVWNDTEPTSSVFTLGSTTWHNASGDNIIAYCFANAEGLCKVGKYTGNSSTDGTFVFTGFRPSFLLIKNITSAYHWVLLDNRRNEYNLTKNVLYADLVNAEEDGTTYASVDFLSNGFKLRNSNIFTNLSGNDYIFLSISEQPFKFSNAR